jgi:transcriptional regulator with GAF, ATPase, and Fis domain
LVLVELGARFEALAVGRVRRINWPEARSEATLRRVTDRPPDPTNSENPFPDVADAFSRVAHALEGVPDLQSTVETIVAAAVDTVPGVEHAGVSLLESDGLRTIAASTELVARLNELEHRLGEGPCVDATVEHRSYRSGDMAAETRWPRFAPAAAELGVSSMLGFRLGTSTATLGSLNLYSARKDAFDSDAEHIGDLFAAHAAVALLGTQQQTQLHTALRTRDIISMAKGILMARDKKTDEQAFATLVAASQHANMKLHDVARWLVNDTNATANGE